MYVPPRYYRIMAEVDAEARNKEKKMNFEHRLYFGMTYDDGDIIEEAAFNRFVRDLVAPILPEGWTLVKGEGQYKLRSGAIVREPCRVLIRWEEAENVTWPQEIATMYADMFDQECVAYTCHAIHLDFLS